MKPTYKTPVDPDTILFSPAGSFDCLEAVINAGADAIYFGAEQLNMRTRSSGTFLCSNIREISSVCEAVCN